MFALSQRQKEGMILPTIANCPEVRLTQSHTRLHGWPQSLRRVRSTHRVPLCSVLLVLRRDLIQMEPYHVLIDIELWTNYLADLTN